MKNFMLIILTMFIMTSCKNEDSATTAAETTTSNIIQLTKEQRSNIELSIIPLELSATGKSIELMGKIENMPQATVAIHSTIEGFVRESSIMPGQKVAQGEVLFKLESPKLISLQQEYLDAKIKFDWLEKEFQRQQKLMQENATSEKNFNEVKMEFEKAKNTMYATAQQLSISGIKTADLHPENINRFIAVKAPISGTVGEVFISNGTFIDANAAMTFINGAQRCAKFTVFEKDLPYLTEGDSVHISSTLIQGETIESKVHLIDPKIRSNGSTEVTALIPSDKQIAVGSMVRAKAMHDHTMGIIVPASALVRWEGKSYVFIAKNDLEFEMKEVNSEHISSDQIELLVTPDWLNNKIVVNGSHALLMVLKNSSEE